ncbi:hypothetical protein C0Q70_19155 [Pomacea canaliculata]|uniref:Uncharacterized protein n=1 Tax=Pomacea canaliculata TaxID=400727 RepID=A0A2T7NII7_POMCA|nr:hypothetical protein C0Q70_19155 [Pomacea canaliculata]
MVTKDNCYTMPRHNLLLAGDVAYGANKQFEPEARTALRLSHFLSNFLQVSSSLRTAVPWRISDTCVEGDVYTWNMSSEVVANVMGTTKSNPAASSFDRYKFENQDGSAGSFSTLGIPWVRTYKAIDMAA